MFRASGTGSGYWLLRQMVLSVPQGMQTEFGLQPFQNHPTGNSIRSPVRPFPANSFLVPGNTRDDIYKSSKLDTTDIADGSLRNARAVGESEEGTCFERVATKAPAS